MSNASFGLFEKEHEATAKFDYFITTIAGALFAYIGQTYTPHKFDCWYYFIIPLALILLTACFYLGCKVLLGNTETTRLNKEVAQAHEQCENINIQLNKFPKNPVFPDSLGRDVPRTEMEQRVRGLNQKIKTTKAAALAKMEKVEFIIKWRNFFLFIGFILILVAKFSQPYFESSQNDKQPKPVAVAPPK